MNIRDDTSTATYTPPRVSRDGHESITDLLKDFRDEVVVLARQEVELAKTETGETVSRIINNSIALAIGSVLGFAALLYLLWGCNVLLSGGLNAAGLTPWVASWLSPLIIGAVVGLIGYITIQMGINKLRHTSFVPKRTVHSLKEDQRWLRQK